MISAEWRLIMRRIGPAQYKCKWPVHYNDNLVLFAHTRIDRDCDCVRIA